MLPQAQAAGRELGVDPRAIIAQAALETGWGTSKPADAGGSHNLFGIKAGAGWQGAASRRPPQNSPEACGRETARFRAYESARTASTIMSLLRDNPRYAAALNTGGDVHAFATALQRGGYATDPDYANKLVAVAGQLGHAAAIAAQVAFKSGHGAGPITQ